LAVPGSTALSRLRWGYPCDRSHQAGPASVDI